MISRINLGKTRKYRCNLFGFYIRQVILIQQILVLKLSSYVSNYNSTHSET